jgi:hypothetical protein
MNTAYNRNCLSRTVSDQLLGFYAPDDAEVSVPNSPETPKNGFLRRSETESVCTLCFATVRCRTPGFLEIAEDVHIKFCVARA